jgi:tRNA modification GTPase
VSDTVVSLLTAPGTGAIATVQVRGPRAWELIRQLFTPAGKPLPEAPELNRFWFGTLGSDEVVLAVTAPDAIEVHCHGGRRVVRWVIEQFLSHGCVEATRTPLPKGAGFESLQRAPTLRTASIILDQLNGAFANEVQRILALLETEPRGAALALQRLAELGNTVGRHLIEPWKVVVAGAPNVGKSSLVNALAGYQRSVVSEVAGTTRDAVSARTALEGWPIELIDTAGLRDAEGLEAEGIERAETEAAGADLVLWVMDGTAPKLVRPGDSIPRSALLVVINKSDAMSGWGPDPAARDAWGLLLVSALTGEGVPGVVDEIVRRLLPTPPTPGSAVPFTLQLAELIQAANAALVGGHLGDTARFLREALAEAG